MTESAALELIILGLAETLDLIQWWASISIGIVALAHYWAKKLTLPLVIAVITLYTLFSVYTIINTLTFGGITGSYTSQLRAMGNAGELSEAGVNTALVLQATSPPAILAAMVTQGTLYLGVVFFLVTGYRRARKDGQS